MTDKPRTLSVVPYGFTGSYLWRSVWPSEALQRHGVTADYIWFDDYQTEVLPRLLSGNYDVVVTPRAAWKETWMQAAFDHVLNKAGLAWVYELDDNLLDADFNDRYVQYGEARRLSPDMDPEERSIRLHEVARQDQESRISILALVDAVTVSTKALGNVVRQYTKAPVHVVPNAIDQTWFRERLRLDRGRDIAGLTVGWFGGWRPSDDTDVFVKVWPKLADRFPQVKFVVYGWAPPEILAALPSDRLIQWKWNDLDDYPPLLRNIDITCCNVVNHRFNASKSTIKWYEATLAGSACVASHMLYGQEITDGYDGLLATTADEWEAQIVRLIEDKELRQDVHRNAEHTVLEQHSIETAWPLWVKAFEDSLTRSPRKQQEVPA